MQTRVQTEREVAPRAPSIDIVAIVAATDGIDALARLLRDLPADLSVPVVVAWTGRDASMSTLDLTARLQPHTSLAVRWLGHRLPLRPGTVSLGVRGEAFVVGRDGCSERASRTSIGASRSTKLLLESIAAAHGERALVVVLGRTAADGASGVRGLRSRGAVLLAQEDAAAHTWGSAEHALSSGDIDLVRPLERIAATILRLTAGSRPRLAVREAPPYEVVAVQRAMRRVLAVLEQFVGPGEPPPSANERVELAVLAGRLEQELRPPLEPENRSLLVDCSTSVAKLKPAPEIVRELARHLVATVAERTRGPIAIRFSALRLFVQMLVTGDDPISGESCASPLAREELAALNTLVKPLRGHVIAPSRRGGALEIAIWIPRVALVDVHD